MDTKQNILLLRTLVEEILDKKLKSSHDYVYLSDEIENRLNERLSVSTLKRIFGYTDGYSSVRERTLNVLSRFIGYPDFKTFETEYCNSGDVYSSQRLFTQTLTSLDLQPDSIVEIQDRTFSNCSNIKYVKIPDSFEGEGERIFGAPLVKEGDKYRIDRVENNWLSDCKREATSVDGIFSF